MNIMEDYGQHSILMVCKNGWMILKQPKVNPETLILNWWMEKNFLKPATSILL